MVLKLLIFLGMKDNSLSGLLNVLVLGFLGFTLLGPIEVRAQTATEVAEDRAADLRLKLDDVKARQLELQDQLKDLDDQMDPQNIENSLAGVGSTRPEDLRELRRRQLERQRVAIQNKLGILAESQTRLETAIADAEADAYRESARAVPLVTQVSESPIPQSNNPAKTSASEVTKKVPTRPRGVRGSVARSASGINNP
jgi:hypothetical protein